MGYLSLNKEFVLSDNPDYRALPSKVSQATMKIVENNYKSFFALKKKGEKDAEIPKYLKKNGRFPVYFTYQAVSYKSRERYLKLSGTSVYIKTDRKAIQSINITIRRKANFLQNLKGGIKAKIAKDLTDSQQREITK